MHSYQDSIKRDGKILPRAALSAPGKNRCGTAELLAYATGLETSAGDSQRERSGPLEVAGSPGRLHLSFSIFTHRMRGHPYTVC